MSLVDLCLEIKLCRIKRYISHFLTGISTVIVGTFIHSRLNLQRQPFSFDLFFFFPYR